MTEEEFIKLKLQFGKWVNALNKAQDMSHNKLTLDVDLDRSNFAKYETGEKNPTLKTIFQIAEIYNVEEFDLLSLKKIKVTNREIQEAIKREVTKASKNK